MVDWAPSREVEVRDESLDLLHNDVDDHCNTGNPINAGIHQKNRNLCAQNNPRNIYLNPSMAS